MVRYSCGIVEDEMLITIGGGSYSSLVSLYSRTGWVMNIGNLTTGRAYHACAKYINNAGNNVSPSRRGKSEVHKDKIVTNLVPLNNEHLITMSRCSW